MLQQSSFIVVVIEPTLIVICLAGIKKYNYEPRVSIPENYLFVSVALIIS